MRRKIIAFRYDGRKIVTSLTAFKHEADLVFAVTYPAIFVRHKHTILRLATATEIKDIKRGVVGVSFDERSVFISEVHSVRRITWEQIDYDVFISFEDAQTYKLRIVCIFKDREVFARWLERNIDKLEDILLDQKKTATLLTFLK